MPGEATLQERHFDRVSAVARGTRREWAAQGLAGPQTSPYPRAALFEIVTLRCLHEALDKGDVPAVWRQVRDQAAEWEPGARADVLVDLDLLRALWAPDPDAILGLVAEGAALRMLHLSPALERAAQGFEIAASVPADAERDQLADHRRRRRRA